MGERPDGGKSPPAPPGGRGADGETGARARIPAWLRAVLPSPGRGFPAVGLAIRNLSRQRLRAALAALGIVIGVFAVVSLGMLGTALQVAATEELGGIGNQVVVSPNSEVGVASLDDRDLSAIRRAASGRGEVIPLKATGTTASNGDGRTVAQVYGTTDPRALFGDADAAPAYLRGGAVVGGEVAAELGLSVGSTVTVGGNSYHVVAVLPETTAISPVRADSAVVIPPSEFATDGYSQVVVRADSATAASAVAEGIRERLNAREARVSVFSLSSLLDRISRFFGLLNGFLLAVAGVSLVVAGVSIFNVMLMTVSERRGEIGVLRAVGIHRAQVMRTLLVEAGLLGAAGGALGAVLGAVCVFAVATSTELPVSAVLVPTNALVFAGALGFGALVALVGGLYPAYRAATDPPVEALRG